MYLRTLAALVVAAALVTGCATQTTEEVADKNQAVRDFIDLRELESLAKIRTDGYDGWETITTTYLIYKTRRADYLLEFARPCWEIHDRSRIVPDDRSDPNIIRARFETLRGCRIDAFYALTEAESAELKHIGDPPGSQD